jgi:hypothetical protein
MVQASPAFCVVQAAGPPPVPASLVEHTGAPQVVYHWRAPALPPVPVPVVDVPPPPLVEEHAAAPIDPKTTVIAKPRSR